MIPSRQQSALGPYGPLLSASLYPVPAAPAAPRAPLAGVQAPAPAAVAQQPAEAPAPPVEAPAAPMMEDTPVQFGAEGSNGEAGGYAGGPAQNQFGRSDYGFLGSALGSIAGLASGIPGLGTLGSAAGTYADVSNLNSQLGLMGLPQEVSMGPAFSANMSYGMTGRSANDQFGDILGFDALAEAPLSAFNAPDAAAEAAAAVDAQNQAQGLAGYGFGTDPSAGIGSGDFGAMSAAERGETVGPDAAQAAAEASNAGTSGPDGSAGAHGGESDGQGEGWMRGGYTGGGPDGKINPAKVAGPAHEGEVIIPHDAVQHYGLDMLMGLVNKSVPRSRLLELARD